MKTTTWLSAVSILWLASSTFAAEAPRQSRFEPPIFSKYPAGLSGYTGVNRDEIVFGKRQPAIRARIGHRHLYKTGLTLTKQGDLLANPCYRDDDNSWRILIFRSQDDGSTWTQVQTKGDPLMGKEPALATLSDGAILSWTSHPHDFRVSRSDDTGTTWKTVFIGKSAGQPHAGFSTVRNVFNNPDGSLTLLMSKGTYYKPTAPASQSWLYRSNDGGRSWTEHKKLKVWNRPESMFDEVSIARLSNGRLLAAGRTSGDVLIGDTPPPRGVPTPSGDESGDHMMLAESADNGLTWTKPRPLLGYSEVHAQLLPLRDGRILCTYSSYHLPYGVFAVISKDGGKTWDTQNRIQLAMSMNVYSGWPTSLELPSGDIITVYAITAYLEGEGVSLTTPGKRDTVAESVRWKLPR